ncbi:molybdenum ABC transporter ATP-binding protein [Desulfonema ishimotonii]|uniref:Molybdenum ABC transporter ATP-binding protein n=1 Tax=Desulfonema ishimotonii TaxID=45657 RepID=A0A401FR54_9BACT|nr:molybdenum ABC transporter ATP-binding protein [Desulfonema ishimotonii]GBC59442.1 molybdenum ABC transporter ATP-binding protein [Desulfonema ishimotonii]
MLDIRLKKVQGNFTVETAFVSDGAGVTALFGHSGAGKTSVINMLAGLTRPDAGHIMVNDHCVFDAEKVIDIPPEKRRFGYVFQDGRLFPHLSVRANLTYGMKRVRPRDRYIRFDQVVDLLGIGHLLTRHPATLSGGEKQRVAIGRSLLTSPVLLLMDEPLASLDAARKTEVLPFIARLSGELSVPILYVSHSVDEILNLADTLVFLSGGKSVAVGSVEAVTARNDFQRLTGRTEAGVVLSTAVESHDLSAGLTRLRFSGGVLSVPRVEIPAGDTVRVRIHPRNVGIALEPFPRASFQNIFQGTVEEITDPCDGTLVDVRLDIGAPLIATITPQARQELDLNPGTPVYAMIKSVSISLGSSFNGNHHR